jgi:hypothetical protein
VQAGRRDGGRLRLGWVVVTLGIALVGCVTFVRWTSLVLADGAWWNVPFGILSTGLTYWLCVAAWRCARAPDDPTADGPHPGHAASQGRANQDR